MEKSVQSFRRSSTLKNIFYNCPGTLNLQGSGNLHKLSAVHRYADSYIHIHVCADGLGQNSLSCGTVSRNRKVMDITILLLSIGIIGSPQLLTVLVLNFEQVLFS